MGRLNILIISALILAASASQAVEIVAHPSVEVSSLSPHQLRNIFFMRNLNWPNGSPVRVYVLDDNHKLHKQFSKQILKVFPYKLRRVWDRYLFSGTGQVPITVNSEDEMMEAVSSTKNAIGYMNKGDANVHIVEIR